MKTKFSKKLLSCFTAISLLSGVFAFGAVQAAETNADTVMGSMTLYDYEQSSVKSGDSYLLFGRQDVRPSAVYNTWERSDDKRVVQGIAADELSGGQFELAEKEVTLYRYQNWFDQWSDWSSKQPPDWAMRVDEKTEISQLTVPDTESGKLFRDGEKIGTYQMPFDHVGDGVYEYDSKDNKLTANS